MCGTFSRGVIPEVTVNTVGGARILGTTTNQLISQIGRLFGGTGIIATYWYDVGGI